MKWSDFFELRKGVAWEVLCAGLPWDGMKGILDREWSVNSFKVHDEDLLRPDHVIASGRGR